MWNETDLLRNLRATLGAEWVDYVCRDLVSIVVHPINGCYDSRQRVIFIDSRQSEAEATQQLIMELSNHQNRAIFADIDQGARTMSRDDFIRRVEELEFAGVQNAIRSYDQAVRLNLGWARGGCVYENIRGQNFDQYYAHVAPEHREVYGRRYDRLTQG